MHTSERLTNGSNRSLGRAKARPLTKRYNVISSVLGRGRGFRVISQSYQLKDKSTIVKAATQQSQLLIYFELMDS